MTPDLNMIAAKYIAIRDKKKEENAKWDKAMADLEAYAGLLLGENQSVKTDSGTVFWKENVSVKVTDREMWFNFIYESGEWNMLTTHVSKEAYQTWVDDHNRKELPPGTEVSYRKDIQFRRP